MSRRTLAAYVPVLLEVGWLRIAAAVALMVLFSLSEGVGVALLLPILQVAGFNLGAQGAVGRYADAVAAGFAVLGIHPSLLLLLMVFAGLVGARALLGRWQLVAMHSVHVQCGARLRQRLYRAIAATTWLALSRMRSSDLIHALTAEIDRVEAATFEMMSLVSIALLFVLYIGIALAVSASMTALVAVCGLVLVALLRGRTAFLRGAGVDYSERTRNLYRATVEHLQSLKAARIYGVEERNADSYAELGREVAAAEMSIERQQATTNSLFEIGSVLILAAVLYVSIRVLGVAPAAVLLLLAMFARVMPRVLVCHQLYQQCLHGLASLENVHALTVYCQSMAEPQGAHAVPLEFQHALRFEAVSFSYRGANSEAPGPPAVRAAPSSPADESARAGNGHPLAQNGDERAAVRDLNLSVSRGEVVALVGPSGAGKSTIADLMTGMLSPDSGRITIDGAALDAARARAWREQIGYVAQDTYLFHDTVRANLRWARPAASEAELRAALALAAAEQFVDGLPQGLDTVVGERGASISHGERQRLALARALLRRPRLLILDEATNSLDAHSEERILEAIERLRGDVTVVTIAHRISAVRRADRICVVENGSIVETGTWEDLCARPGGRFRALCESQGIVPGPIAPPASPAGARGAA